MSEPGPSVQRLGHAVLLQGPALAELRHLAILGAHARKQRDGIELGAATRSLIDALSGKPDVAATPEQTPNWSQMDPIDSGEAAKILGLCRRQVVRLAKSLGARRISGKWVYDRDAVVTYAELRRANEESA